MDWFSTYYGLDWASSIVGLIGLYLVTEKRPVGFLLSATAVLFAVVVALMAGQYGFLLSNVVTFFLSLRGYVKWN